MGLMFLVSTEFLDPPLEAQCYHVFLLIEPFSCLFPDDPSTKWLRRIHDATRYHVKLHRNLFLCKGSSLRTSG